MKKLMLIATVLMIAGGVSAHGNRGYDRDDRGCHERVVVRPYYDPYIVVRPAPYYDGGYRRDRDRDRRYDRDRDYRGGHDRDSRYYR
jgi:hypothetical protein